MNEEKKTNKKKVLTYYLILGACILVIAAITVTVIFAVKGKTSIPLDTGNITDSGNDSADTNNGDNSIRGGGSQSGGNQSNSNQSSGNDVANDTPSDTNNGNTTVDNSGSSDSNTTVSTKYEFVAPVDNVDLINSYTFYKNNTLNYYHFHTGLDFAADAGTAVYSCIDGTIEDITTGDLLDGTTITISHDNGIKTVYKFVDALEGLNIGDSVKRGQVIGSIAEANGSEYKDGAHLHFEVYSDGTLSDPEDYLTISVK
jgi:murein DD-endopeptidase MepM/ murein hydrolase activator NlpD